MTRRASPVLARLAQANVTMREAIYERSTVNVGEAPGRVGAILKVNLPPKPIRKTKKVAPEQGGLF